MKRGEAWIWLFLFFAIGIFLPVSSEAVTFTQFSYGSSGGRLENYSWS